MALADSCIDERPFLCYDKENIIINDGKGYFQWEIPQKINQTDKTGVCALASLRMYEPTDGNNPSKPHKIGPFFLM